jgi:hypothetical protein
LRSRSLALAPLGALVGLVFAVRPLAYGIPVGTIAVFWATVLGHVVVPGVLLCRGARLCPASDRWLLVGQGTTLGLVLHGLSLLAGRAVGAPWLTTAVSLAASVLGLALAARERPEPLEGAGAPRPRGSSLALAVALVACLIQPLFTSRLLGEPVPVDLLFHSGNAAELRHRWPLEDPRVAGLPLSYHLLAYALPVEASARAEVAVADALLGLAPLAWVALLAVQLANAGRVVFRDATAGVLGGAAALLHADPGRLLGLGPGAFASHFATGVYGSPPTVCGLIVLAGLAIALDEWMERGGPARLAALGLLAAGASAAKTTVLPVVVGAVALVLAAALARRRLAEAKRWAAALAVAVAAGVPLTLWQAGGEASYPSLVAWAPWAAFEASPFAAAVARWVGPRGLGAWALPAFVAWFAGYLGLAGVGTAAWLGLRREALRPSQAWALAVAAVGAVFALTLDVPGSSQLFMLYNGQLLLCLFAGAGLVLAARSASRRPLVLAGLLLCALPSLDGLLATLPAAVRATAFAATRRPGPVLRDFADGLEWLRTHAADGVVFADDPSFLLSALGEVRLYYENGLFTARGLGAPGSGDPFPERTALQERLLRRPDASAVEDARRAIGPGVRLLVVADYVPSSIQAGHLHAAPGPVPPRLFFPPELFARRFVNGAMQVYEAREPPARPTR